MNFRKIVSTILLVYLSLQLSNYLIHTLILGSTYDSLAHLWRPDVSDKIWIRFITDLIFSVFFVYIFVRGYENKGVKEGIRFGLIVAFFYGIPMYLSQFMLYRIPSLLIVELILFGFIIYVILGVVCAISLRGNTRKISSHPGNR